MSPLALRDQVLAALGDLGVPVSRDELAAYPKVALPMAFCLGGIKGEALTMCEAKGYPDVLTQQLSHSLPMVVDKLTPQGQVPAQDPLAALGSLASGLGGAGGVGDMLKKLL